MSDSIRVWNISDENLEEVPRQRLDLESRLEAWMQSDVSVLSDDLLVIGKQINTRVHGILDLVCLNRDGDIVVVELKREKTPREVTAQALDYGAWAAGLSAEDIVDIGDAYLGGEGTLAEAFRVRFDAELPDVLNNEHHLLIVASEIGERTERIIHYLSETHGVSINAVTFNYFRSADGRELLARTHLIEPEQVEVRTTRRPGNKRRRSYSVDDHREEAEERGVGDLFALLVSGLSAWRRGDANKSMLTFYFKEGGGYIAVFNVITSESDESVGLRFNAYKHRLARLFGLSPEAVRDLLPSDTSGWKYAPDAVDTRDDWEGFTGAFRDAASVRRFLKGLNAAPQQPGA